MKQLPINNNSGFTQSLWMEERLPEFPQLNKDLKSDVVIVGSGIAGLTCAYTLAKRGKSVVVLDQGVIAGGQSARTTAHLTWALDDYYHQIEKVFGKKGAKLAAESHAKAIDSIEEIVNEEKIDCDFVRVDGYLFKAPEDEEKILDDEFKVIQKIGMPIKKIKNGPHELGPCLQFPNQGQFHLLKYLRGLAEAIVKCGGQIYSYSPVKHFEEGLVCTPTNEVRAKNVIVATCTPVNDRVMMHTKQAPYRTYVIAASVPKGSVTPALYWDTKRPAYHYIRLQNHETDNKREWLIIGGEDHKTGQEKEIEVKWANLEKWSKRHFPMIEEIEYKWSGQVFEPVDYMGFIGKNPGNKHIYIVTGDSGNGMTHGTIAGLLIPDLIVGKKNPWKELYEPSRKTLSTALTFLEENLNVALQYKDWFTPGEIKQLKDLPIDEGVILRKGIKKLAVYKDKKGQIHLSSAFCPHLGACVRWNDGEKSWDCPAHGSRFDACGHLQNGPALGSLTITS